MLPVLNPPKSGVSHQHTLRSSYHGPQRLRPLFPFPFAFPRPKSPAPPRRRSYCERLNRTTILQRGAFGHSLGFEDEDLASSPGWWAAIATYCLSRMVEHSESNQDQPNPTQLPDPLGHPVLASQHTPSASRFIWFMTYL